MVTFSYPHVMTMIYMTYKFYKIMLLGVNVDEHVSDLHARANIKYIDV